MKKLSILSGMKSRLLAAERRLSRGAKRSAFIRDEVPFTRGVAPFIRGAALALLCCVCTAGVAQTYTHEVEAWKPFTLTNVTAASVANPAYQWYENGRPLSGATGSSLTITEGKRMGMYVYTRSVTNTDGCGESNAITVKVTTSSSTLTPTTAASKTTWTNTSQQWSDEIKFTPPAEGASSCVDKSNGTAFSGSIVAEYRVVGEGDAAHYYYSWLCAYNNREAMCNNGWKFPTEVDFGTLIAWINTNWSGRCPTTGCGGKLGSTDDGGWGWGYSGFISSSSFSENNVTSRYWASVEGEDGSSAFRLGYLATGYLTCSTNTKWFGYQVRCVK
jgi:uncharacterized protein (TIGR02145 family)